MIVYRTQGDDLEITLQSDEELGILDTGYVEDFDGVDGQVSLFHVLSSTRYPLVMNEVLAETPLVDHDVFLGTTPLAPLPDGIYQVQGRVRDVYFNYSILSDFSAPVGGENVVLLEFEIRDGVPYPPPRTALFYATPGAGFPATHGPLFRATSGRLAPV